MSNRTPYFLTPSMLLRAYAAGIFPMAESAEARELSWYDPPVRALIPLDEHFHVPRRLARTLRQKPCRVTVNTCFEETMRACAAPHTGRETTWINGEIIRLYTGLHRRGHAHSIEVWDDSEEVHLTPHAAAPAERMGTPLSPHEGGRRGAQTPPRLIGGLYGVSLGKAFFGESMFSRRRDASKIALTHLVALLRGCGYTLLDTQFQTPHLAQFGTFEIARSAYHLLLQGAVDQPSVPFPRNPDWDHLLAGILSSQPVIQIS